MTGKQTKIIKILIHCEFGLLTIDLHPCVSILSTDVFSFVFQIFISLNEEEIKNSPKEHN
jgi:hypothetical protein